MTQAHRMFASTALLGLVFATAEATEAAEVQPLPQAHAHNDYHHRQPLHDALRHGFCSVEADIFLDNGDLLVGHDRSELRPDRTLQALYLDPLRARVASNQGQVYRSSTIANEKQADSGNQRNRDGPQFTLLVDIKSDGPTTYAKLSEVLAHYPELCSTVADGALIRRAIDVVVSGNRPIREIEASDPRRVFVDGRIRDLDAPTSALLVPLVSDNWSNFFAWRGEGPLPQAQHRLLLQLVDKTHQRQQRLRFWATPDDPRFWKVLAEAKVDVIGTDDLSGLQQFLSK